MPENISFNEQFNLDETEEESIMLDDASTVDPPPGFEDEEIIDDNEGVEEPYSESDDEAEEFEEPEEGTEEELEEETDIQEDDIEYIEIPDFLPEDLVPPEDFENEQQELEFYRSSYPELVETMNSYYSSPEFAFQIINSYEDELLKANKNTEELMEIRDMLHNNPLLAIKKYFSEGVQYLGGDPKISEPEMIALVDKELKETFGSNYREKFDESEVDIKGSLSNKIIEKQNAIMKEVEEHNKNVKEINIPEPPTEEELKERAVEVYKNVFEPMGLSQEDYVSFIQDAKNKEIQPEDYYKIVYMDDLIRMAYERGKQESSQRVKRTVANMGGKRIVPDYDTSQNETEDYNEGPIDEKKLLMDIYRHR